METPDAVRETRKEENVKAAPQAFASTWCRPRRRRRAGKRIDAHARAAPREDKTAGRLVCAFHSTRRGPAVSNRSTRDVAPLGRTGECGVRPCGSDLMTAVGVESLALVGYRGAPTVALIGAHLCHPRARPWARPEDPGSHIRGARRKAEQGLPADGFAERWVLGPSPRMTSCVATVAHTPMLIRPMLIRAKRSIFSHRRPRERRSGMADS